MKAATITKYQWSKLLEAYGDVDYADTINGAIKYEVLVDGITHNLYVPKGCIAYGLPTMNWNKPICKYGTFTNKVIVK